MIASDFSALAERLREKARVLAEARRNPAERRGRLPAGRRWRRAAWLWPLFTKG